MPTQSSKTSKSPSRYSVGMFSAGEARCDRWQDLAHAGQTLVAQSSSDSSTKETLATVEALLAPLSALETFRAYPGEAMMTALKDALGRRDYSSFSRITNRIVKAIITGSYRRSANAHALCAGHFRKLHGLIEAAVSASTPFLQFLGRVLRVVDQ